MADTDTIAAECQQNQQSVRPAHRVMFCGRCGHATSGGQGHYWRWCKRTEAMETHHFCCPGSCGLVDGEDAELPEASCHPASDDIEAWADGIEAARKAPPSSSVDEGSPTDGR